MNLRERIRAEIALEREKAEVEQLRLELQKEERARESPLASDRSGGTGFEVAESLCLLPKYDEKDPDIFFALFKRVAQFRGWPDSHQTLRSRRAFSALSPVESGNSAEVKATVLKAYTVY